MRISIGHDWDAWGALGQRIQQAFGNPQVVEAPAQKENNLFPAINVWESESAYYVTAEIPGVAPESLAIDVTEETLTLSGKRQPSVVDDEAFRRQERWSGAFRRELTFLKRADTNAVEAEVVDGILTIVIPKASHVKPRRVAVKPQAGAAESAPTENASAPVPGADSPAESV